MKKSLTLLFLLLSTVFFAQKQSAAQDIANDACNCIAQITIDGHSKNKAIKNCIDTAITTATKRNGHTNTNTLFRDVENYLVEHCEALKKLAFSENERFENATSKNVLAQLAYDDGLDYLSEKDYENALKKFKKATSIDPNFAFAWDNLGISYRKTGQFDKAIDAYKRSLQINPKGKMPLLNIAVAYNLKKDHINAEKYYKRYIANFKDDPEGFYGLGLIQYLNDDYENGLDNMITAYKLYSAQHSPYRTDAANKISYIYHDLKKKEKLDIFNRVAKKHQLKIQTE